MSTSPSASVKVVMSSGPSACSRKPHDRGGGNRRLERGSKRGVAEAVGTVGSCTRVAFAAVVALVLLSDNTSARSSLGTDSTVWRRQRHRQQAWHLLAPSVRPAGGNSAQGASSRAARTKAASTVAGTNPAQMYRVSRAAAAGGPQGNRVMSFDRVGERDSLQSPRSAIAGDGREYPERLTVYSTAPGSVGASSIAEGVTGGKGGVVGGEFGRPFLPALSEDDITQLRAGQRVQKQTREGGSGSGSVVVDVRADPDVVLGLLTKYEDYAEMIDTVRQCEVFPPGEADTRKVEVTVSRFRLHIRVVMSLLRDRNMVQFELDPDCTKAGRAVLREATGFFFVESVPDRPGYSRVWMLAKVDVNRFVPGAIVDYAAGRALPRASNWIKPTCEAAQRRKLRALGSGVA